MNQGNPLLGIPKITFCQSSARVRIARTERWRRARRQIGRRSGTCRACCDAPPVFETTGHDLDLVAAFVSALVVFDGLVPGLSTQDARGNPLFVKGIAEPVGIVTAVAQQPVCFGQTIHQGCRSSVIADLPRRHEEADGAAPCIRHSVKLRVHAAFRAPDQPASTPPFFP